MKLEFICLIIVITIVIVASYFIAQSKTYDNLIEWEESIPKLDYW